MATQIGTATEDIGSRRGGGDIRTGDSWEERLYLSQWEDSTTTSLDARNAAGAPNWGDALTGYTLYCVQKEAHPDPLDQKKWRTIATFRTPQIEQQTPNPDPGTAHKWNVVKSIVPIPTEIPINEDATGKIICNVIGEAPNPPLTDTIYDFKVSISFYTDAADQTNIEACLNMTNEADIDIGIGGVNWIFPAGEFLLKNAPIQEVYDSSGSLIAQVSYECYWRPGGWVESLPNISFNKIVSGKVVPILDTAGQPVAKPQYLDASGVPIAPGGSIVVNDFTVKASADYTGLMSEIS